MVHDTKSWWKFKMTTDKDKYHDLDDLGLHLTLIESSCVIFNPEKTVQFYGYQALSYYYVSWALALRDIIAQLKMPFDKKYQLARKLTDTNLL